ncbi:hypothetical protein GOC74_11425 [Halomicrobium mukohataei]|uniref:Uncharacterized protein n=1 Tax=Halomicrobium mukohataei TaxID=57705 RepID=A0A847UDH3_9EURY|nr:hypothetical protein [Halomicrobium mukohataei]NLV10536.1 hypothetical protein [Halomicrobium mukohataei]
MTAPSRINEHTEYPHYIKYILAGLALVLLMSGGYTVYQSQTMEGIVRIGVGMFVAFLSVSYSNSTPQSESDEPATDIAAAQAFWLLITLVVLQSIFQLVPTDIAMTVLGVVGVGLFAAIWIFYQYLD